MVLKGIVSVYNKNGTCKARISPEGKYGINFVLVEPKTTDDAPLRYAIDKDGKIICQYKSLSGIMQFKKNFNEAVKYSKNPQK